MGPSLRCGTAYLVPPVAGEIAYCVERGPPEAGKPATQMAGKLQAGVVGTMRGGSRTAKMVCGGHRGCEK